MILPPFPASDSKTVLKLYHAVTKVWFNFVSFIDIFVKVVIEITYGKILLTHCYNSENIEYS